MADERLTPPTTTETFSGRPQNRGEDGFLPLPAEAGTLAEDCADIVMHHDILPHFESLFSELAAAGVGVIGVDISYSPETSRLSVSFGLFVQPDVAGYDYSPYTTALDKFAQTIGPRFSMHHHIFRMYNDLERARVIEMFSGALREAYTRTESSIFMDFARTAHQEPTSATG